MEEETKTYKVLMYYYVEVKVEATSKDEAYEKASDYVDQRSLNDLVECDGYEVICVD